jgi:hypothetical protein
VTLADDLACGVGEGSGHDGVDLPALLVLQGDAELGVFHRARMAPGLAAYAFSVCRHRG